MLSVNSKKRHKRNMMPEYSASSPVYPVMQTAAIPAATPHPPRVAPVPFSCGPRRHVKFRRMNITHVNRRWILLSRGAAPSPNP